MTDDTVTPVDMDDLDTFSDALFGKTDVVEVKDEPEVEEEVENEDTPLATEETEDPESESEPEEEAEEPEAEEEEEEEEKPEPKKNRKSFQTRIDELTKDKREAERREAELLRRLEALEKSREVKEDVEPTLREQLAADAPSPDALDKDGNPIYVLGEFDPKFIRDLTRYTIEQETKAAKIEAEKQAEQERLKAQKSEIETRWLDNLAKAEEEVPEIRENIRSMETVFADIDPQYGEYLATTVMSSDYGPAILNYLSQNIGVAQKIVASGPTAATLAIGRLEAKFATPKQEEPRHEKKVSNAPKPPQERTRGSGSKSTVAPDTDDLDAFESVFF